MKYCASHFALRANTESKETFCNIHSIDARTWIDVLLFTSNEKRLIARKKSKMASAPTNEIQKQFRFSVPVNSLEKFNTPEIHINEIPWKIQIRKEKIENRDVINVSLVCCYKVFENKSWSIEGGGKIKLVSFKKSEYSIEKTIPLSNFDAEEHMVEIRDFITHDDLFNDEKEFIKCQALRFEALITTIPLNKQIESKKFDVTSAKFGVVVKNIQNYEENSSKRVKLCGIEWFVKFQRNGDYCSVYLDAKMEKDEFAWSFNVNFIARLLSNIKDIEPVEKKFKQRFSVWNSDWGWSNFIEIGELVDLKYGYIDGNYHCLFEISIDVERELTWKTEIGPLKNDLSSSKMECPICFNLFAEQEVVITRCGHLYCGACIKTAIENRPRCPYCNAAAAPEDLRVVHLRT